MAGPLDFQIAAFRADDAARMKAARHIRQIVFCEEQGVSAAEEWDGKDDACEHFLLLERGEPIACARLRPYTGGATKVERVAVLKDQRGRGAGAAIMQALLARLAGNAVVLNAQLAVEGFYAKLGFVPEGEIFYEAGIAHIHMVKAP